MHSTLRLYLRTISRCFFFHILTSFENRTRFTLSNPMFSLLYQTFGTQFPIFCQLKYSIQFIRLTRESGLFIEPPIEIITG